MQFSIDHDRSRNDTRVGVDLEQSARVAGQAIRDCVGRRIEIKCIGSDPNDRSNGDVFVDFIGSCISVGWCGDVEFVRIDDCNREDLVRE